MQGPAWPSCRLFHSPSSMAVILSVGYARSSVAIIQTVSQSKPDGCNAVSGLCKETVCQLMQQLLSETMNMAKFLGKAQFPRSGWDNLNSDILIWWLINDLLSFFEWLAFSVGKSVNGRAKHEEIMKPQIWTQRSRQLVLILSES